MSLLWFESLGILIGLLLVMMSIGMPVGIAFMATNLIGAMLFAGGTAGVIQIVDNSTDLITSFVLSPIPMFVLMGCIFFHSQLATRVFDGVDKVIGNVRGRLSYLTVAGGTLFSMLTGSTMANTAMLASTMAPEMTRRGYSFSMSMGPILGTGGLAMLIPPSSLAVLLASLAGIDVGKLLVAGIVPGFLLALLYVGVVFIGTRLNPAGAPAYDLEAKPTRAETLRALLVSVLPMTGVIVFVVMLILFGIATPTEAAAFGVLGVMVLALTYRRLNWSVIRKSLNDSVTTTGMLFFILINSTVFSQLLAMSGASGGMIRWVLGSELSPGMIIFLMLLVLLFLGMLMDSISIMLITVPIFFPLVATLQFDPIWFAVIVLVALEMGLTTPPFGMLLFIALGFAPKGTKMSQVAAAASPYLGCDAILIGLVALFPGIALALPRLMG